MSLSFDKAYQVVWVKGYSYQTWKETLHFKESSYVKSFV
jgi:hypothetical protein